MNLGDLLKSFHRADWLSLAVLSLVAAAAFALLYYSTPVGLGMVNDTFAYVAGAHGILDGKGYSRLAGEGEVKPITHFPPMFSFVLAVMGLSGIDVIRLARLDILLLFAGSTFLVGIQLWLITRSRLWGLLGAVLFMSSGIFLRTYAMLMSEPLFIFLSLISNLSLAYFIRVNKYRYLVIAGLLAGMTTLTRYAGLALLLTSAVVLIAFEKDVRRLIRSEVVYFLSSAVLIIPWLVRNQIVAGNATNRQLVYHVMDPEKIHSGLVNFLDWLLPGILFNRLIALPWLSGLISAGIGLLVVVISIIAWLWYRSTARPVNIVNFASSFGPALFLLHSLYIWVYFLAIVITILFYDASTPFENRILMPAEVSLLIVILSLAARAWFLRGRAAKIILLAVVVFYSYGWIDEGWQTMEALRQNGLGFAATSWRSSKTIEMIRDLPQDMLIYSNRQTAIYLLSRRSAYVLPTPVDPSTSQPRADYQAELAQMRANIHAGRAVLIYFFDQGELSQEDSLWFDELRQGLTLWYRFGDSKVYKSENIP